MQCGESGEFLKACELSDGGPATTCLNNTQTHACTDTLSVPREKMEIGGGKLELFKKTEREEKKKLHGRR